MKLTREQAEELQTFVDTGEATEDFMDWLGDNPKIMKAVEQRFRSDDLGKLLTEALGGNDGPVTSESC